MIATILSFEIIGILNSIPIFGECVLIWVLSFEIQFEVKYSWEIWNPSPTINEVWLEIDWIVLQENLKCQWNFLRLVSSSWSLCYTFFVMSISFNFFFQFFSMLSQYIWTLDVTYLLMQISKNHDKNTQKFLVKYLGT